MSLDRREPGPFDKVTPVPPPGTVEVHPGLEMHPGWYHLNGAIYYPEGLDGPTMTDLGPGTITIFKSGHNSVDNFIEGTHKGFPLKGWEILSFEDGVLTLGGIGNNKRLTCAADWYTTPPF